METLSLFLEKYPAVRALSELICPWLAVPNAMLQMRAAEIRKERHCAFFKGLAKGDVQLSEELVKSEDFLHAFFATYKAAINTRRRKKIELFSRLLLNSFVDDRVKDVDEYEHYLKILDDIGPDEFGVLLLLDRVEEQHGWRDASRKEDWLPVFYHMQEDYRGELTNILGIPKAEHGSLFARLSRTGCVNLTTISGAGSSGISIQLSPSYYKLKELVKLDPNDFEAILREKEVSQ